MALERTMRTTRARHSGADVTEKDPNEKIANDPQMYDQNGKHDGPVPIPRSEVVLPLEEGTHVKARNNAGKWENARIVKVERVEENGMESWQYYVHHRHVNRRTDEWKSIDDLDLDTVVLPGTYNFSESEEEVEGEGHEVLGDHNAIREHNELTKVKNINEVELGRYCMKAWYWSPFPDEFANVRKLYFCEYDLAFFKHRSQMLRHLKKVKVQHPPGIEIYRHNGISMFEVDGSKAKTYCQNLCYLAKLFLDHKSLDSDVDIFLFYVMCECDEHGAHPVGYFSKEKMNPNAKKNTNGYARNLACILTFPAYQKRGYGKFLISFSYELSKIENIVGEPERPISDLGWLSYLGYWKRTLLKILKDWEGSISIAELSDMTKITPEFIIRTLQELNMIQYVKGQHVICAAPDLIEYHLQKAGSPGLLVESSKIVWSPYIPSD